MKKTIISVLAALMLMLPMSSCSDDWLSLSDPNLESSDTFWKTEEQFQQGLYAGYATLRRPGVFSRWFHILMILRSDEGWSNSPNAEFQAVANFKMTGFAYEGNESVNLPSKEVSQMVYYVNQVVDNMNDHGYDVMDKDTADGILGQAYFLRAIGFWYMAGTYGVYPCQISSLYDGEILDQEGLYKQALADFDAASKVLPDSWPASEAGRPTKGGSLGMMARCNMQLAGICKRPWENRSQEAGEYWLAAKKNMDDIFAMGIYDLVPNWLDNFTDVNENNKESLVEINFKNGLVDGKEVGMQRPKFLGLYISSGEGAWDDGSAREWLLDEFDKERDKDGNMDIRKRYTLTWNDPTDNTNYYGKTYAEWDQSEHFLKKCYWRKYTSVDTDNLPEDYSSGTNFRLLRLADVYLMYAEVLNELGQDRATAVEYMNKVRRRVNMRDLNPAVFGDYESLKEQLRHDRLVELCGECTRWNDLDRWGDIHTQEGVNKIAERDPDFDTYRVGMTHLYVIPQHEISLFPGLTQHPAY
ncbi:MAG: RagB/SusD family nutrient uptake outer membrane protein [Muribaculaceae bacterium]|nr:RagB/SusD family nutrient uptake outer membrane protein [Muribaculaceae bacterium]